MSFLLTFVPYLFSQLFLLNTDFPLLGVTLGFSDSLSNFGFNSSSVNFTTFSASDQPKILIQLHSLFCILYAFPFSRKFRIPQIPY